MSFAKSYNKMNWLIKIILALIPVTAWFVQGIYRVSKGHVIAGVLYLVIPCWAGIGWLIDLITVIMNGKPTVFA